ncbi:MAG: amino acid permease [Pirellulaceae bacterium]
MTNIKYLGLPTLVGLVIANMIGAGVFTSSGYSLDALGNPDRVMLAWGLCGVWAICGAVAYGGLVSRLPMSGGEYLFLSRFVHPSVGFLAGWISVIAGFTAPIALAAQGAAVYVTPMLKLDDPPLAAIAAAIIVAAAACHLVGVSIGTGTQNAIVAAKLALLMIIIVWAMAFTSNDVWQGGALAGKSSRMLPDSLGAWRDLAGSMSWVALSYTGFNAAVYVAEEARDAERNVPRSMLVGTLLVTIIYLLLNYVFVYAPAAESIARVKDVAAVASLAVGGTKLELLVRATIVLAMISSVFAMLLAGPRVYQKMADDGVMPALFRGSPNRAIVAQAVLSLVAVFSADLLSLMQYLGLTLSACGGLAVLSLWWVRLSLPDAAPLRWWETAAMAIYLSITLCILAACWLTQRTAFYAMLATFVLGAIVYVAGLWWDNSKRAGLSTNN